MNDHCMLTLSLPDCRCVLLCLICGTLQCSFSVGVAKFGHDTRVKTHNVINVAKCNTSTYA